MVLENKPKGRIASIAAEKKGRLSRQLPFFTKVLSFKNAIFVAPDTSNVQVYKNSNTDSVNKQQ